MNIALKKNSCLRLLLKQLFPLNATGRGTDGQHQSSPLQHQIVADLSRQEEVQICWSRDKANLR